MVRVFFLGDDLLFDYESRVLSILIGNYVYANGERIGKFEASSTYAVEYYLTDHLGSVVAAVENDGDMRVRNLYRPWGEKLSSYQSGNFENQFQYTGQYQDEDLSYELAYYGQRYYDQGLKIFTSVDPLWEAFPEWGSYVYCKNNPILYVDPNGDSVQVGTVDVLPVVEDENTHSLLILTDEETGYVTIMEGMPERKIMGVLTAIVGAMAGNPMPMLKGTNWGNLVKEGETKPSDLTSDQLETVSTPEGMTDEEFRANLAEAYESYGGAVKYAPLPPSGTGNSNSLTGSLLRAAGSAFVPANKGVGWDINVLQPRQ